MIIKRVSLLLFPIIVFLFISQAVLAAGDFTINLYENEREVIFSEDQESQTIYMDGVVNYTGISVKPDTISLSSYCDLGESNISPEYMTFHTTGSEEFTVELIIPNNYENGTTGLLQVEGTTQQYGVTSIYSVFANIVIINHSHINDENYNLNNTENNQRNGKTSGINSILMVSIGIIVITIIVIVIYKRVSV